MLVTAEWPTFVCWCGSLCSRRPNWDVRVFREGLGWVTKPGSPVSSWDLGANSPGQVTSDSAEPGLRSGKATLPLGPGMDHPPSYSVTVHLKKLILKKSCSFTRAGIRLSQVANAVFYSLLPEAAPFHLERGKDKACSHSQHFSGSTWRNSSLSSTFLPSHISAESLQALSMPLITPNPELWIKHFEELPHLWGNHLPILQRDTLHNININ